MAVIEVTSRLGTARTPTQACGRWSAWEVSSRNKMAVRRPVRPAGRAEMIPAAIHPGERRPNFVPSLQNAQRRRDDTLHWLKTLELVLRWRLDHKLTARKYGEDTNEAVQTHTEKLFRHSAAGHFSRAFVESDSTKCPSRGTGQAGSVCSRNCFKSIHPASAHSRH